MRRSRRMAAGLVAAGVLALSFQACGTSDRSRPAAVGDPAGASSSAQTTSSPGELDDVAATAGEQAANTSVLLLVVNDTPGEVVLTSDGSASTASIAAGASLRFATERVCEWLPLTARTQDGEVVARFDETCRGQTWTIRAP